MSTEKTTEKLVLDPVPEGVIPVDEWVPSKKETIVTHMDKMIMIPISMYSIKMPMSNSFLLFVNILTTLSTSMMKMMS